MLKKFSAILILLLALMISNSQQNSVEAAEVYVGSYSDGTRVMLLTESVHIQSRNPYSFTCSIRAGRDYLDYSFFPYNGSPYYRNSEGYEGYVHGGESPVAAAIYRYVLNNW